jgi:DNA polymerase-3 subunit beta
MKVEIKTEELRHRVSQVEKMTGRNLTLPVLSSILLIASGKTLKLRATNLSIGIEVEIPAKVDKEGVLAISGATLNNTFTNIFQNESAVLEGVDGNLIVKTKRNTIKLKGESSDDFPTIPRVEGVSFEIESKKLIDGIKSVYYSSSFSDIKPEISSVFIYTEDENLVFVSTDSFRLAEKKVKVKNLPEITGILVPFKNISELLKIFGDVNTNINISFNKNQISFSMENVYITSRVIDGVFPDYRQIIPKNSSTNAVLLKQDLINALKLSNIFSDRFNQVNLKIDPKGKIFELSSVNNDVGENKTNLEAALSGSTTELSFNYKYFMDCFASINTDSILIKTAEASQPIIVSGVSDTSFIYLIMPMNR